MNKDILKTPLVLTWAILVFVGTPYVADFIWHIYGVHPFRTDAGIIKASDTGWYIFIISWIMVSFGLSFFVQMVWEKIQRKD